MVQVGLNGSIEPMATKVGLSHTNHIGTSSPTFTSTVFNHIEENLVGKKPETPFLIISKLNILKLNKYFHLFYFAVLDLNSQLLYIAVNYREICVALTRYTENQLADLKQNPMTYTKYEKCLKRPVQLRRRIKPAWRRLKRAVTTFPIGDETEPIVIDDDREPNNNNPVIEDIFGVRRSVPPRLPNGRFVRTNSGSMRSVGEKSRTATDVIVVDLCSSDDEQSKRENRGERILSFSPNGN